METGIETCVDKVFLEILGPLIRANNLQAAGDLGQAAAEPERLTVTSKNEGEERSVKVDGYWGRKIRTEIVLRADQGDKNSDWMEDIAAKVYDAIVAPSFSALLSTAPFQLLVIQSIETTELTADKTTWLKAHIVNLTALLK